LEVAQQYLLGHFFSLPVGAPGSESETGKCHRELRESRRGIGTKNSSVYTTACCVGLAKPGSREKVT
jgi:hypothetical protein